MRRVKRIVAFLFVIVLAVSLVGCNKKENVQEGTSTSKEVVEDKEQGISESSEKNTNNEAKDIETTDIGNYIETELKLPEFEKNEMTMSTYVNSNGELELYTTIRFVENGIINCYVFQGDNVEKKPVEWANKVLNDIPGVVMQFEKIDDSRSFLFVQNSKAASDSPDEQYMYITSRIFMNAENGLDYVEITPKDWNQKDVFIDGNYGTYANSIKISKEGIMTYRLGADPMLYPLLYAYSTKDQASMEVIDIDTEYRYVLKNNSIYYIPRGTKEIAIYDFSTKETKAIPTQLNVQDCTMEVNEQGDIYLLTHEGIHHLHPNGTMWETVLDGATNTISSPSKYFNNFNIQVGEHQAFYIYFTDVKNGEDKLAAYQFSTDVTAVKSIELGIYSLRENKTIREAISGFQKTHPGVNIEYFVAMTEQGELNISDEIRSLNTELLAGKGADILLLDGLPINSYIEKDVLLNLSDILLPMIQDETLTSNVTKNYTTESGIYAMPLRYFAPIYVTEQDTKTQMDSMQSLSQMCQSLEKNIFPQMKYDELLQFFLYTYYDEFMLDNKAIDTDAFSDFLTQVKLVSDHMEIWDEDRLLDSQLGINSMDSLAYSIFDFGKFTALTTHSFAGTGYAGDISDFNAYKACANKLNGEITTINDSFMPSGIVCINKMTKQEELAKEFIMYLFSEELQSTRTDDGFPLNANSLESWCNIEPLDSEGVVVGKTDIDGKLVQIIILGTSIEEKRELKELILKCEKPIFSDEYVLDMIKEQSLGYLTGEKTLEQAVNDTTSKINLYLLEQ